MPPESVMRLSFVLPLALLLALAACDQASKTEAARTPLPVPTPITCPPAPACPPAAEPKMAPSKSVAADERRKAASHARPKARHVAYRAPAERRRHAETQEHRYDSHAYAGREYYGEEFDGPARFSGGPAFEERNAPYDRYDRERETRGYGSGEWIEDEIPPPPPPPAAERRYAPPPDRYSGGRGYEREWGGAYGDERRGGAYAGSRSYGYESGRTAGGVYGERRRYESYSETESHRVLGEPERRGPCCVASPGAAGFDGNGFLTWPGKVPAQP